MSYGSGSSPDLLSQQLLQVCVPATDCDHDSIDIEKKVFADAGMEVELKQAITEDEV